MASRINSKTPVHKLTGKIFTGDSLERKFHDRSCQTSNKLHCGPAGPRFLWSNRSSHSPDIEQVHALGKRLKDGSAAGGLLFSIV
jgi:hypothetical protein